MRKDAEVAKFDDRRRVRLANHEPEYKPYSHRVTNFRIPGSALAPAPAPESTQLRITSHPARKTLHLQVPSFCRSGHSRRWPPARDGDLDHKPGECHDIARPTPKNQAKIGCSNPKVAVIGRVAAAHRSCPPCAAPDALFRSPMPLASQEGYHDAGMHSWGTDHSSGHPQGSGIRRPCELSNRVCRTAPGNLRR